MTLEVYSNISCTYTTVYGVVLPPYPITFFNSVQNKIVLSETVEALTCALCGLCASKGEAMCGRPEAETFTIRQGYT